MELIFERRARLAGAWTTAFASHLTLIVALTVMTQRTVQITTEDVGRSLDNVLVWIPTRAHAGDAQGGGSGGDDNREPPRPLARAGPDHTSMPSEPPPPTPTTASREPDPLDHVLVPAKPFGDALASLPGLIDAPPSQTLSQGPGSGPGAGTDRGGGFGRGRGDGIGNGGDRGCCEGVYQVGDGVHPPVVLHIEQPQYSNDAMRARIQGVVVVQCVVRLNGFCSDIHVTRSLDPRFGLDEEARRAAALWRFRPGTRFGEPVPVQINIELTFTVR